MRTSSQAPSLRRPHCRFTLTTNESRPDRHGPTPRIDSAVVEMGTRKPFHQRGSFWLGPFSWGLGLVVAVGLAIGWYVLGGFPRDHDHYGEVAVPGQAVLSLPKGDVRLNFENHATHSGDSTTLDDRP